MDAWTENDPPIFSPILNYNDPLFVKVNEAKAAVQLELRENPQPVLELLVAAAEGDLVTVESTLRGDVDVDLIYPENGLLALVYAVAYGHTATVETLLSHQADPNVVDGIRHLTPLMWACHFSNLEVVKVLLSYGAETDIESPDGTTAASLVTPDKAELYAYFKSHNLFKVADGDDTYFKVNGGEDVDPLTTQLQMHRITSNDYEEEQEALDEEALLSLDHQLVQLPTFDYDKLLPEQYIKFTDSDIPRLLDYIFELRTNTASQHDAKIPAAIVFQLLRYSHLKVDSKELSEFLFECFVVRLRSVTNTKSGVFNMAVAEGVSAGGAGDIVLLSYWLSVIQFLHFYLAKQHLYTAYPQFLQELVNLVQSLVATLSFSINSRLNTLVDECIMNFTNLVDVSTTLYAKDWNLFKNKHRSPNTYDDIFDMLYPPTQKELMKPLPVRYVQVLGALDYVLKLHEVDTLLRFQTFSQVFYYINATFFNRIIGNSKYCSRVKAIQLRLNISTIEDWLRSHNAHIYRPDSIGGLTRLVPDDFKLTNLLEFQKANPKDPHTLAFYYNSLYNIGKMHLAPTIELLQWLQCMSALSDGDSLINTINSFDTLNYYQLFKVFKLYKYEVNEQKVPKALVQLVKLLVNEQGETQVAKLPLHYVEQLSFLSKESYISLNPNFIFAVALPNLQELINNYGAGLGGVKELRAKKFQPSLPVGVLDDVDELVQKDVNDTYEYEAEAEDDEEQDAPIDEKPPADFKGDELFKQVQMPSSLAHKHWGEENPW